jgi:hypothetical protein
MYEQQTEYDGWPMKLFSHEAIMEQDGIVQYVWPDEGKFSKNGNWNFHKGMRPGEKELKYPASPMMVDASSARAYQVCFPTMAEKNQNACKEKCESARWWFGHIVSEVFWANVSFGGR